MRKSYVILGAGISGLSLAWYLQKEKDAKITVIEKEQRPGGWVETGFTDEFLFEYGPRSCRTRGNGLATLHLIEELGLENQVIAASEAANVRYLYLNRKLVPLPKSLFGALFSPVTNGLFKALWTDLFAGKGPSSDESITAFSERRLGRAFAERFVDPLVTGIFAGDPRKLSLRACFPFFAEWENQGGIVKGLLKGRKRQPEGLSPFVQKTLKAPMISFRNGMETLPKAIAEQFKGELILGETVEALSFERDCATVRLSSGGTISADKVFSTLPAYALKWLIPFNGLNEIPFASVATVHLGYRKPLKMPPGFGYLIPSSEVEQILGIVFDSCVFPEQSPHTRISAMLGDSRISNFDAWPKERLLATAQEALSRHLGIEESADYAEVRIAKNAIPQYQVGHLDRLSQMESQLTTEYPRLAILGSSFYGVSVNDCVARSQTLHEFFRNGRL